MNQVTLGKIAQVCHDANKGYCEALGDFSQPFYSEAPQWQRDSAALGVMLHVSQPNAGPEASHESWMMQKVNEGWTFGLIKDPVAKTHPCIRPFNELSREQQAKDFIFRAIVHAFGVQKTEVAA